MTHIWYKRKDFNRNHKEKGNVFCFVDYGMENKSRIIYLLNLKLKEDVMRWPEMLVDGCDTLYNLYLFTPKYMKETLRNSFCLRKTNGLSS